MDLYVLVILCVILFVYRNGPEGPVDSVVPVSACRKVCMCY